MDQSDIRLCRQTDGMGEIIARTDRDNAKNWSFLLRYLHQPVHYLMHSSIAADGNDHVISVFPGLPG